MTDLLTRALRAMPGGVSSPVRAFNAVPGEPPIVARAQGPYVIDATGKRFLDLVGSWGPLILGHAHPAVVEAVTRAARDGLTYGATCAGEIELAEQILARYPFAERVRFVSSGTEAVMSAVRLARGATGRARIVKFEGCYHGHSDGLLVKAGSGLITFGTPTSAGVPAQVAALTEVLPLDDEAAAEELFRGKGDEIACVLVEPMPANNGLLVQRSAFLRRLRALTREHGALLLFDEVISGLRVAPGGMVELSGIEPDLVTLGKIIGGGMPVGAYIGSAQLMEQLAPTGPVYQAGTLSGNPLAMAAGLATLRELEHPGVYQVLEGLGARLEQGWSAALLASALEGSVVRVGSVLWLSLQAGAPPRSSAAIAPAAARRYGALHAALLADGVWMAPSAYEVAFLSTAHDDEHVDQIVNSLNRALRARDPAPPPAPGAKRSP
jgi:glutamate-1-semialdehyde 2,1-aminomutase